MALPEINNVVPIVRAPQSRVSEGQIAAPYNEAAGNLAVAGETLSKDVAVPLAERAGLEAVTRDDNGDLSVARLPIVGPAADHFARAVKFSALAQSEAEARRKDLDLAREHQNDPQGYLTAANAFKEKYVGNITKSVGPEVGISLGRTIDSTTTQQYNGLLAQQQATIRRNFDRDTHASIQDKTTDLLNLVNAGGGDTPAAARLATEITGLYHERVNNPVLAAPPGETEIAIKKLDQEIGGAKFAYTINKTLTDPNGGPQKAMDQIDAMSNDISLSPTQRAVNQAHALVAIKDFTQDSTRFKNIAAAERKQRDDSFEDEVIQSTATDNPASENDIKKANVSPEAKMRMLSFIKRDGVPEPLAHVSEQTSQEVIRRMGLPEGDPQRINSLSQITNLYAPPDGGRGQLKRTDYDWLSKTFKDSRTPGGEALATERKEFFKAFGGAIDPNLGMDPKTAGAMYLALKDAQRQEDALRAAGKDPHLVYDPRSPEFFGSPKNLEKYKRPLDQQLRDYQQANPPPQPTMSTTPAFVPPRTWDYSQSRRQYRDPATGKIYDASGKEVKAAPIVPMSR